MKGVKRREDSIGKLERNDRGHGYLAHILLAIFFHVQVQVMTRELIGNDPVCHTTAGLTPTSRAIAASSSVRLQKQLLVLCTSKAKHGVDNVAPLSFIKALSWTVSMQKHPQTFHVTSPNHRLSGELDI